MLSGGFLSDLGLEIITLVDQLAVGLVAVGLEARDDLFLLGAIDRDGFQDHRVAADFGDIVFQHLEPARVVVGLRQQAHAVLEIDRSHPLEPAPQRNTLRGRFRRHLIGQQQPWLSYHGG